MVFLLLLRTSPVKNSPGQQLATKSTWQELVQHFCVWIEIQRMSDREKRAREREKKEGERAKKRVKISPIDLCEWLA